ncbi:hypothetical protein BU16DRAFT_148084 [Lophium mytilinum]|uniref:Uncharacterized protein n=1 Tax=Lophium mytilinum TaxID=390894 RepID=A0A6A6QE23_9PEZI|nr:hypothetical protein BU16DRAFT_148084 [Lophium mytilinum]
MGRKSSSFNLAEARKGFDELLRLKPNIPFELCDTCQSADSDEPPHPPWLCLHQDPKQFELSARAYKALARKQICAECSQRRHVHNPHSSCDCPYKSEEKRQQLRENREKRLAALVKKEQAIAKRFAERKAKKRKPRRKS